MVVATLPTTQMSHVCFSLEQKWGNTIKFVQLAGASLCPKTATCLRASKFNLTLLKTAFDTVRCNRGNVASTKYLKPLDVDIALPDSFGIFAGRVESPVVLPCI